MPNTLLCGISYPNENDDPWFDEIVGTFGQIDQNLFAVLNTVGNVLIPPAGLTWTAGTKTLSWSLGSAWEIVILNSGFSFLMPFGPDGINPSVSFLDGERLIATVPNTSGGTLQANLAKSSGKQNFITGLLILGFCRGTKFYGNFPQVFS